jgi:peptidoglycan/xylan/chitin deacetylase (PgdA/CDA1 family)
MLKKIIFLSLVLVLIVEIVAAPVEWFWPVPWGGNTHWAGQGLWNGPEGEVKNELALTFDDGPSTYTAAVLDILKQHNAKGTFFVMGREVERYPEILKRMAEEGHEVGNHTYDFNAQGNKLFSSINLESIKRNQQIIQKITGKLPRFYRSPGGQMRRGLHASIREESLQVVNGILPMPHPKLNAKEQLAIAKETLKPGAIIILHDGDDLKPDSERPKATVELLPELLKLVDEKGLKVVTVSELLK